MCLLYKHTETHSLILVCSCTDTHLHIHYIYKSMQTLLQNSGFCYFSPVADRCIQSSTQPCNLHRQTWQQNGHTEELSDLQRGTVIGRHLSNKSVHQISALLELPQSTVSAVIMKWKRLGSDVKLQATHAHRTGLPSTEARKNRLSSVATLTTEFQTSSGSNVNTITVSMAKQQHTSLRSPCAMPSVGWSGVKLAAIGLWISGNMLSGVMNHSSPTDKSEFGGCQENATCRMHSANCKVWQRRNNGVGLFFMVWAPQFQ